MGKCVISKKELGALEETYALAEDLASEETPKKTQKNVELAGEVIERLRRDCGFK